VAYQPKDGYYRKAKREGYRSRAAYKLLEINQRFRLIRPGNYVVDLGAAPGGWLQVVSELVGPGGRAYGFDLQPMQPFAQKNIHPFELDVLCENSVEEVRKILRCSVDCVLSDMAPRLSGIRDADLTRASELIEKAYEVALGLLKSRGGFLFKTFTGVELGELLKDMSQRFENVQRVRVNATRKGSSEIYVVAKGFEDDGAASEC
jgi:23S rRNA (uridine2552-2'-O)-methyltransferase